MSNHPGVTQPAWLRPRWSGSCTLSLQATLRLMWKVRGNPSHPLQAPWLSQRETQPPQVGLSDPAQANIISDSPRGITCASAFAHMIPLPEMLFLPFSAWWAPWWTLQSVSSVKSSWAVDSSLFGPASSWCGCFIPEGLPLDKCTFVSSWDQELLEGRASLSHPSLTTRQVQHSLSKVTCTEPFPRLA